MSDEEPSLDEAQAHLQVNLTDISRRQRSMLTWGGGDVSLGETDFEGYQLNSMLDMVESAKPSDLEAAADALSNASDAIEGVGEDIKKYAANVDWEGESGDAFRTWADNLGKNTLKLASYTGQAGIQMRAASIGLASVKSGMPPREYGPYLPVDIQEASAADDPRERNRQEAINQMNRLSSFYKVSHDNMATQEEPTFAPPPDFGVPEPSYDRFPAPGGPAPTDRAGGSGTWNSDIGATSPTGQLPTGISTSARPVHTEINNATAYQAPPVDQVAVRQGPTTGSPPSVPNSLPVVPPTSGMPQRQQQRSERTTNVRNPQRQPFPPYQSNAGPRPEVRPGGTPPAFGRPSGPPVGNPAPVGQAPQSALPPRTGRPDAISGGMPYRPGPVGPAPIPQGRVAGTEPGATARTPMGGNPSAVGPVGGAGPVGAERRRVTERGGVSANPRGGAANRAPGGGFFTPGGMGLVHRPSTSRAGIREEKREGSRPDYLSADEATWKARREIVPPVVE
ncbi:WXG100 family type VII secretion target [Streptomyces sp. WMMC897]|uniref:WXG100 family type VII secretion target n=1 Tax=Streptomyces sp. WMMC897 TaxID=3014782 RepID=UPI0022B6F807|nr:hypothetical protein [Streptomyces sp. WMMC897]MCZ7416193.1 hypothetical protein [Streptomyces sp. WMMC897]